MTIEDALRELRQAAAAFEQHTADDQPRQRLRRSVIRPLDQALTQLAGSEAGAATDPHPVPPSDADTDSSPADRALALARRATRLRVEHDVGLPLEVVEAVGGLQDLVVTLAPNDAASRRATLADLQASLPSTIHTEADGPYLVTNPQRLHSWLGVEVPAMPQMALCRCGQSASKPLCDGTQTSGSPTRRTPAGSPTGSTPRSACNSPSATTAAPAHTRGCAPTGYRRFSSAKPKLSWRPAAAGWTRSSTPCRRARQGR